MSDHAIALWSAVFGGASAIGAIVAVVYAQVANNRSRRANEIAGDARTLAANANDIAARAEARETEQHDVHWESGWDPHQPGRYLLIKRGDAEARNVRAKVRYGVDEQIVERDSVTA